MSWRKGPSVNRQKWARVRRTALEKAGYRCSRCSKAGRLEVHHVQHLKDGGQPFDLNNLAVLCRNCHIHTHKPSMSDEQKTWLRVVSEIRS